MGLIAFLGTLFGLFSVVGNDCVQTLSTFIQSCRARKASIFLMSIFLSAIFVGTLCYGYFVTGDAAFGRLDAIPYQEPQWFHLIPLVVLGGLTYWGIPVSTTFIVLSVFSSNVVMMKMIYKSVMGGALAFAIGFGVWFLLVRFFDERKDILPKKFEPMLILIQALATGLLLMAWVSHDVANILVFLPRGQALPLWIFVLICLGVIAVLTAIVYTSGGRIQKIVANKSGTNYVLSATIIDLVYSFVLFYLKGYSHIPMSTTWAFIGLILGRECAISFYHDRSLKGFWPIAQKDVAKLLIGAAISIFVVKIVHYIS